MGDIAQILNIDPKNSPATEPSRALKLQSLPKEVIDLIGTKGSSGELPPSVPASGYNKDEHRKKKKSSGSVAATATSSVVKIGNKFIPMERPARKWVWAPFSSSARTDGLLLHHWVRGNVEYPDYPYARFDIHLDPVTYANDDEYHRLLEDPDWTKAETDRLLHLAKQFELRWPIVHDRWIGSTMMASAATSSTRKIEDLQHRYYSVAAILLRSRISHEAASEAQALAQKLSTATAAATATTDSMSTENPEEKKRAMDALLIETAAARALAASDLSHQPIIQNIGTGSSNKVAFDLQSERERRNYMEALWNRTKQDEEEEAELRKELKQIEAQLRKLKKSGAHILAAGTSATATAGLASASVAAVSSTGSSRNVSRATTPLPPANMMTSITDPVAVSNMVGEALATTAPVPVPGTPYLQSARLVPLTVGGPSGINRSLRTRMDAVLEELNISRAPIATKRACDLYDTVRKDVLTLLILQKTALEKEGLLASKRLKLAKQGGNVRVVDEETLLGISPPPKPSAPSATTQNRSTTSKAARNAATSSSKGPKPATAGGTTKTKSATEKTTTKTTTEKPDSAAAPSKKQAPVGSVVTAAATGGGKQAPGAKQSKKSASSSSAAAPKRKRKSAEASSSATAVKDPAFVVRSDEATVGAPTSSTNIYPVAPVAGAPPTAPSATGDKVAPSAKKRSKKAAPKEP